MWIVYNEIGGTGLFSGWIFAAYSEALQLCKLNSLNPHSAKGSLQYFHLQYAEQ